MRCDPYFNGTCPLVHHFVYANLEHLIGAQRPAAQDHAMVEVISGAVKAALFTLHHCSVIEILQYYINFTSHVLMKNTAEDKQIICVLCRLFTSFCSKDSFEDE